MVGPFSRGAMRALSCVLVIACASASPRGRQPDPAEQGAERALKAGEPERAVEVLRAALQAPRAEPRLRAMLPLALIEAGAYAEALGAAEAALSAAPADPSVAASAALVHAARWESSQALKVVDDALGHHPNDGRLLAAKGQVLWQLKRTRSAIAVLQTAARDERTSAEAQYWLGEISYFLAWQSEGAFPGWHDEPEYPDRALSAFEAASKADPEWYKPRVGLGETLLQMERPDQALAAFDAALGLAPNATAARVGRWKALKTLGRSDTIGLEVAAAANGASLRQLDAARQGYELIGRQVEAASLAERLLAIFPGSAAAAHLRADAIEAARAAKKPADVIVQAQAFVTRFPFSVRVPAVYDALLDAYQATPAAPLADVLNATEARIRCRPDPGAYVAGAGLLLGRRANLDRAITLAEQNVPAMETFVNENLVSYKMADKAGGALERSRAAAADTVGWAQFLRNDRAQAAAKLGEAERLSRGQDTVNQFHLGKLARAKGTLEEAREYYLNALSLSGGPAPVRVVAHDALADIHGKLGGGEEFDSYLSTELDRRREERRTNLLHSMVDRQAPPFKLTDVPTTMYTGRDGTIRYQVVGGEPHGDSGERISWFIEELKRR